jgi:hypothetical protein
VQDIKRVSGRRAARVLRAPRRTTRRAGGMRTPSGQMRVAWASSGFHAHMRMVVGLPVSGQTRHGAWGLAWERAGCHERSRTGVTAGGTDPRARCAMYGLSAGPVLGRAGLLWPMEHSNPGCTVMNAV